MSALPPIADIYTTNLVSHLRVERIFLEGSSEPGRGHKGGLFYGRILHDQAKADQQASPNLHGSAARNAAGQWSSRAGQTGRAKEV
jgi:hypothetical protein